MGVHRGLFYTFGGIAYEAPIDYASRPEDGGAERIHRRGNLVWTCTDDMLRTLRLRRFLLTPGRSPDVQFFKTVLDEKIRIKTYLTDRAQTGDYKTNREKRWETHPRSVQFALRATCMAIEYVLIRQLCAFDGFPPAARTALEQQGTLPPGGETFRCPITLDPMNFAEFREALLRPVHGKSSFQVGHLNPLKLDAVAGAVGHTADNISWISADGNRIQGSLGLADVRALLLRIAHNYDVRGAAS